MSEPQDTSGNTINYIENSNREIENITEVPAPINGRQLGRAARRLMYDDQMLDFLSFLQNSGASNNYRPISTQANNNADLASNLENMILVPLASQGLLQMLGGTGGRSAMSEALAASFDMKPRYKKVLSEEGESSLEKVAYNPEVHQNDRCPILHIEFEEGDEVTQLPCKHCFDSDAIEKWLKDEKAECPVCRLELKSKEVKIGRKLHELEEEEDEDDEEEDDADGTPAADPEVPSVSPEGDEGPASAPPPNLFQLNAGRMRLVESLARSMNPGPHPFGPRNGPRMMAHIVNDQDDDDDLQRAIMASLADYNSGDV